MTGRFKLSGTKPVLYFESFNQLENSSGLGGSTNYRTADQQVGGFFSYVLLLYHFSQKLDRYYIGPKILNPEERLHSHLTDYYGCTKFTAKVKDWALFLSIEHHIK